MTINTPNSNNCSCNTSKCSVCNYKFVCASSPYCCINNISNKNENSIELSQKIEELEKFIAGFVNSQASIVSGILEEFKKINSNIDTINNSISELSKTITENTKYIQQIQSSPEFVTEDTNQIVPFAREDEKVVVEKKGLFGKSKWVEEKK